MSADVCLKKSPEYYMKLILTIMSCCMVSLTIPHCIDSQKAYFALVKMIKRTNLGINDAACLEIVHIFQHPTSRPTTRSTQTTMVDAPKQNFSLLPAGKHGILTKRFTQRHHEPNEGKSGLEAERVWALGALRIVRSKNKLEAEN